MHSRCFQIVRTTVLAFVNTFYCWHSTAVLHHKRKQLMVSPSIGSIHFIFGLPPQLYYHHMHIHSAQECTRNYISPLLYVYGWHTLASARLSCVSSSEFAAFNWCSSLKTLHAWRSRSCLKSSRMICISAWYNRICSLLASFSRLSDSISALSLALSSSSLDRSWRLVTLCWSCRNASDWCCKKTVG